jgi:hypothetical protein
MTRRLLVLILLPVFLGLSRGIAEASRYDFNGAGNEEIIVWDGDFEVSTESNVCNNDLCTTLKTPIPGFGFVLSGQYADLVTLTYLEMILMSSEACGGNPHCGAFSDYFTSTGNDHEYDFGGKVLNTANFRADQGDPAGEAARNVFFARVSLDSVVIDGRRHFLTPFDGADAALIATYLAASDLRVGMVSRFSYSGPFTTGVEPAFTLTQVSAAASEVPEPATLTLLGTGIAAAVVRRRRARR